MKKDEKPKAGEAKAAKLTKKTPAKKPSMTEKTFKKEKRPTATLKKRK